MYVYRHFCLSPLLPFRLLNHSMSHQHQQTLPCFKLNLTLLLLTSRAGTYVKEGCGFAKFIFKWRNELKLPYITMVLLSQVFLLVLYGLYVYVWKFNYEVKHTWRYANTHPHTQLTPQQCMGLLLKSAHHLQSSHFPSTNYPSMNAESKATETHTICSRTVPDTQLLTLTGKQRPLRSEWLRLHYPVKAAVLETERFIETHIYTQTCVRKHTRACFIHIQ